VAKGEILIGGDPLGPDSPRSVRSRVAVILQDPSAQLLQPTVLEEVAFAARNLDLPSDTVDRECRRWISAFGLEDVLEADPATLSAGRQQLVLLAGALASRPRLLVADEPGAHLDPEWRSRVLQSMEGERRGGLALIWATQDPRELAAASRVLVMGESVAASDGPPSYYREEAATGDEALLELEVAPVSGHQGPRVETRRGFELRIGSRGVQAVTGPNGTGKSVLLASASGLEPIPQVRVTWMKETDWPPILVAQYPERLFFEEFVRDEVAFAARSRGMSRDEIEARSHECFSVLNMEDITKRRLWELSGGARRLVEVVAALIAPAPLIALDEPTAGLDGIRRRGLADLVRKRAKCSAVLIASQDVEWLTMAGARLVEVGHATVPISPSISKKTD
jgi:energy-coupling factor transport system ATP-binding protein